MTPSAQADRSRTQDSILGSFRGELFTSADSTVQGHFLHTERHDAAGCAYHYAARRVNCSRTYLRLSFRPPFSVSESCITVSRPSPAWPHCPTPHNACHLYTSATAAITLAASQSTLLQPSESLPPPLKRPLARRPRHRSSEVPQTAHAEAWLGRGGPFVHSTYRLGRPRPWVDLYLKAGDPSHQGRARGPPGAAARIKRSFRSSICFVACSPLSSLSSLFLSLYLSFYLLYISSL
jgi:hypothetical protein